MDELDNRLIALLRHDARASLSEIAARLSVQRSTVRARMDRLIEGGDIVGFTVQTRSDVAPDPVRGLMMLQVSGKGADNVLRILRRMPDVRAVHSTNGAWDLIAEIGTQTLESFDEVLFKIRRIPEIAQSETNLLLSTRR